MKKILNLNDWRLDKNISNAARWVDIKISLKYPDQKQFIEFKPKERVNKIDQYHKDSLNKLLTSNLFGKHEVTGTKKRPNGITTKVKYGILKTLNKLDYIDFIWIQFIDNATKIEKKEAIADKYFCVSMTVVVEIEGVSHKKQNIEKRLVLIKANSFEDAYEKLDKQKDEYSVPYLNTDGRFVRWRIHSFDDCYETDINNPKDLDNANGVEVYSKLKLRKTKTTWNGNF